MQKMGDPGPHVQTLCVRTGFPTMAHVCLQPNQAVTSPRVPQP